MEILEVAEKAYNQRALPMETQIIVRLRDRLGTAANANEMIYILSKFKVLFVRPKVHACNILAPEWFAHLYP